MTRAIAQLSVRRGPEAIAFYEAAFGAVVDYTPVMNADDLQKGLAQIKQVS